MYKQDFALGNLQLLMCHKTKPNHIYIYIYIYTHIYIHTHTHIHTHAYICTEYLYILGYKKFKLQIIISN